jgi:hypothetical protein
MYLIHRVGIAVDHSFKVMLKKLCGIDLEDDQVARHTAEALQSIRLHTMYCLKQGVF